MARALVPALLLGLALPAAAEVHVEPRGPRLDLTAKAAPLTEVLDRLARQVGLKIVYEGAAPRQLVTLTLRDRTASEAVLAVLEGQGVNFALVWDETGARLQTLMIAAASATASTSGSSRSLPEPGARRGSPPPPSPNANEPGFEPEPEEPAGEPPAEAPAQGYGPPGEPPPGTPVPPATIQVAPQQQFPVSPFAPQPPAMPQPQPAQPANPPATGQAPPP